MTILKGKAFINSLDEPQRKKLNGFLKELCDCATYQFSDKRYEWGIEDFIAGNLGVPLPYSEQEQGDIKLTEEEIDASENAMYEAFCAVIDEFGRTFKKGLR